MRDTQNRDMHEDGGRNWSYEVMQQETLGGTRNWKKQGGILS